MVILDCLIVRQPYASLIAYGLKRWEFRSYNCKKRGLVCIASSRGKPLKTGDSLLNSISKYLPRGFALAVAVLADSRLVTSEDLKRVLKGKKTVRIDGHRIVTASDPLGEPVSDILAATKEGDWKSYAWVFDNVSPFQTIIPIRIDRSGSTWTKIEIERFELISKSLSSYF